MIHLLPRLRFLHLRRNRPVSAPQIVATAPAPVPAPVEPWTHTPPSEPYVRADRCGWCRNPIPDNAPDGEFCSPKCQANWLGETYGPTYGPVVPPVHGCEPPPPSPLRIVPNAAPEPAWIANWTTWEQVKAEQVIAPRKSPAAESEAA